MLCFYTLYYLKWLKPKELCKYINIFLLISLFLIISFLISQVTTEFLNLFYTTKTKGNNIFANVSCCTSKSNFEDYLTGYNSYSNSLGILRQDPVKNMKWQNEYLLLIFFFLAVLGLGDWTREHICLSSF